MGNRAYVLVGVAEVTLGVGVNAKSVGYTTDGVVMTTRSDFYDAKVDENVGTVLRRLTDQDITVSLNMAEGTLAAMAEAIPGSSLVTNTLTIGGAALQTQRLTLLGKSPNGRERVIVLKEVNPTGEVAVPYKKGEASIVPVTFSALVDDAMEFGHYFDAEAPPPTLVVGADTKSNDAGTEIEAKFSKNMAGPEGKHEEFWFTEADFATPDNIRTFSAVTLDGDASVIILTVEGTAIEQGKALKLFYRMGTVHSANLGALRSFEDKTVVARS